MVSEDLFDAMNALIDVLATENQGYRIQVDTINDGEVVSRVTSSETMYRTSSVSVDELAGGNIRVIQRDVHVCPTDASVNPQNACFMLNKATLTTYDNYDGLDIFLNAKGKYINSSE